MFFTFIISKTMNNICEMLSILITTHNREYSLAEVLNRLTHMFANDLSHQQVEIIVFNDGSTDRTESICMRYKNLIRYLHVPQSVGYIEGRRRLAIEARGSFLLFLDDDSCPLDSNAPDVIKDAFRKYPSSGVIAANIAGPSTRHGQIAPTMPPLEVANFIGCGHVLRGDAFDAVGGYAGFLKGYGSEETSLVLRMLDRGYKVMLIPRLRVFHAQDPHLRNLARERAGKMVNELAIVLHSYPMIIVLPSLVAKLISHLIFNVRNGSTHQTLSEFLYTFPRVAVRALISRSPVRLKTIVRYRHIRNHMDAQIKEWANSSSHNDIWLETFDFFPE